MKLEELWRWLENQVHEVKDESQKAHYFYGSEQIRGFQEDQAKVKITPPLPPPMGLPL